jgi:TonB-dependent SusC/RagA subfamily outer membrane receptor
MKTKAFLLFCLFMGYATAKLTAQESNKRITITGTVLDAEENPIANAIVMIDGQKTNALTRADGSYKIKVKPGASRIGIFTFGNGIFEEDIAGRTQIDFNFGPKVVRKQEPDQKPAEEKIIASPGDQVINTGYNKVRKKYLTTSASKLDRKDSKKNYTSIYDMLREVPGVVVHQNKIVVHESKNLWGYIPPLLIVDGVPYDINNITDILPSTVESIEVLKGTSAAIYGSRGYGGVLLITTKGSSQ